MNSSHGHTVYGTIMRLEGFQSHQDWSRIPMLDVGGGVQWLHGAGSSEVDHWLMNAAKERCLSNVSARDTA